MNVRTTGRPRLSPFGTALERFVALHPRRRGPEPPASGGFVRELLERVEALEVTEESVYIAWELARQAAHWPSADIRALSLAMLAVLLAVERGSTRLPLDADRGDCLRSILGELGLHDEHSGVVAILAQMEAAGIIGPPGSAAPLVRQGGCLYPERLFRLEARLVTALVARCARACRTKSGDEFAALIEPVRAWSRAGKTLSLSDEQATAVRFALERPLTLISGGPGTGKTAIIVSMLRAALRAGIAPERIALAAPTGKAANRMEESVAGALAGSGDERDRQFLRACPKPETLHRLLGYSPGTDAFRHHVHNRLAHALLIVDEASMIDLALMERLIQALTDDARLVLLGDADQLPSVGAGAAFRDLTAVGKSLGLSVSLSQSYRMSLDDPAGRTILSVAHAVRDGSAERLFALDAESITLCPSPEALSFTKVELVNRPWAACAGPMLTRWLKVLTGGGSELAAAVRRVFRTKGSLVSEEDASAVDALYAQVQQNRILCVTRAPVFREGAEAINAAMHESIVAAIPSRERGWHHGGFCPGEPVLIHSNDYERGLFNGDQGIVLRVTDGGADQLAAVFPRSGAYVAFPLETLRSQVAHAYAMTVHKSQGSEFARVLIVLPGADMPLLTREVLYTAITRSKSSVVIIGSKELLIKATARSVMRSTGLAEDLIAKMERPSYRAGNVGPPRRRFP